MNPQDYIKHKELNIVRCSNCKNVMTKFERSKYERLDEHWGGVREIKPYCSLCYNQTLDRKASALKND